MNMPSPRGGRFCFSRAVWVVQFYRKLTIFSIKRSGDLVLSANLRILLKCYQITIDNQLTKCYILPRKDDLIRFCP